MEYTYKHPKADVTVDAVVFGYDGDNLRVLLVQRDKQPLAGRWALPGGFIHMDEALEQSVLRVLTDKTGVTLTRLEQLATFGDPGRDPRGRVISVAYMALTRPQSFTTGPLAYWFLADEITEASVNPHFKGPALAFDHYKILKVAVERLRSKIRWQPVGIDLLPREFTLGQLECLYEAILGRGIERRNFRRKVLKHGLLVDTGHIQRGVGHRPGALYRFDKARYDELRSRGIDFEV